MTSVINLGFFPQKNKFYKLVEKRNNLIFSNTKFSLYKNIKTKLEFKNINELYLQARLNKLIINVDCIELDKEIIDALKLNKINIDKGDETFYPNKFMFEIKDLNHLFLSIYKIFPIKPDEKMHILMNHFFSEIKEFVCTGTNLCFIEPNNKFELNKNNQFQDKIFKIYSLDMEKQIILSKYFTIIITKNYAVICNFIQPDTFIIISDNVFYFKNKDGLVIRQKLDMDLDTYRIYGYIKNTIKKELFNFSIDSEYKLRKKYQYQNKETSTKINYDGMADLKQQYEISNFIKSKCKFIEYNNFKTQEYFIISEYTKDGSSNTNTSTDGLRYRGKYIESSSGTDKPVNKKIFHDKKLVFEKEDNNVKVDLLERKTRKTDEFIIGYKVAKSISGEIRIVKLAIPPDAQIARPIDSEYFINLNKQRASKAIVLDIQLPIKDKEISVVPEEKVAYSYIYKVYGFNNSNDKTDNPNSSETDNIDDLTKLLNSNNINNTNNSNNDITNNDITNNDTFGFEYVIGKEVFPNSFNPNEDIGCGEGIHFYEDKSELFEVFINEQA